MATTAEINAVCDGAVTGSNTDVNFPGSTFYWTKIGNVVVVYWKLVLSGAGTTINSADGLVPAAYRPTVAAHTSRTTSATIYTMSISTSGRFSYAAYTLAGVAKSATETFSGSITYII